MMQNTIFRAAAAGLFAATLVIAAPFGAANAQQAGMLEISPIKVAVKSVAGKGSARFDWLAGGKSDDRPAERVASRRSPGTGSWICSPSGFGSKSRCYQR
ncbi:hypothetical protein BMG00_04505 [Thioclava marina]|jgi:hypothetical protein|uniref:Uncharacterized protein n=2 Tax=Thioclava marina TaxID=1915077 RepID=A0ABX3MNU5_9RHOB|nr:hypothetical protein BMG00_04505 [Thioclava marina]